MTRIAILNEHLGTFGGGERAAYALASTLAGAGFSVDVLTRERQVPSAAQVAAFFGPRHDGFGIRALPGASDRELQAVLRGYTVFVNHSAGSSVPNPCPLGVYFVMFPFQLPGPWLAGYHHLVCNSLFTARHTRVRWGPRPAARVIYPAAEDGGPPAPKVREIVALGRFAAEGHRKNQAYLADAFVRLAPRLPEGWRLSLVGKVNRTRPALEELLRIQDACEGVPVELVLDASDEEKRARLARAAIFWHATGALLPPDAAAFMEHFGIAIVEAMSAGAVPICFDEGGPREIVDHGETGFLFQDVDGLVAVTERLARDEALLARMSDAARARAARFSRARFDAEVTALFGAIVA